jgi:hypothetical protein
VAGYHLSQLALYHFLITTTLSRPEAFRRAGTIVIAWSLIWVVPSLLMPGRGGGAAGTWFIVLLCYASATGTWWAPVAWAALPIVLLDVLTSGYRTLWVHVAGQLSWLAAAGFRGRLRWVRGTAATLLVVFALGALLAVSIPSLLAPLPAAQTLERFASSLPDGGYRLPEALIGIAAFREGPVFGRGVGYQTPPLWLDTMEYMRVGPIYHVYYVGYLANMGIVGLAVVLWYFAAVLFSGAARAVRQHASHNRWAAAGLGLQAAFVGAVLGAFLSGPVDGHWTWGVFGAGALLPAAWAVRNPSRCDECPLQSQSVTHMAEREATVPRVGASHGNA